MKSNHHDRMTVSTARGRNFLRTCGCAAALGLGTNLTQAQTTDTWNGGGADANWMTAANWLAGTAPNPGDSLVFAGSAQTSPNNNFAVDTLFGGILFAPTAAPFTLSGNEITLSGLVENDATNQLQTLSLPLILTNAVTFNTSSNDLNGGVSDDIYLGGNVSGAGSLVKIGVGNLFLTNGVNSYAGGTTVSNGLVDINTGGTFTMSGGSLLLDYRSYYTTPTINFTADSAVGISLLDNTEPRGIDVWSTVGTAGFKFTKIGAGILRMVGSINASSIDVAAGTLASLGGGTGGAVAVEPLTKWGTSTITVESGAMLRADDGGVCPNAIILNGGDGTSVGSYTHEGVLVSGSRNNGGSTTNYNIFTNTITLAADSTIGSYYNTMIIAGNISGPGAMTVLGTAITPLVLSGSNSFTGTITINAATVQAGSSSAVPVGAAVTLNTASTLDLAGNTASVSSFYDDGGGLATLDNTSTNPAALTITSAANFNGKVQNSGGGPLSIINISGGTSLQGVNSYTGATMVEGGSLDMILPAATTTGGLLLVTNSASLSVHFSTPGSSLQASAATLGNSSADTTSLTIDLNGYGNVAKPVINATNGSGVLTANGTIYVTINNPANITVGSIHLIKYTTLTGSGTSFMLNPIAGVTATIVTNAANKSIDLAISQAPITTWTARISTNWDYVTTNWVYAGIKTNYQDNEAVFFDDTASNFLVNLTATLTPGSVLLNATNTYLFTGPGSLGGGTLTKNGAGTLILDVLGSTYASTTISAGTLQVGNNDGNGDLGAGSVNDQGTLSFNLTTNYTVQGVISGAGALVKNNTNTLALSTQPNSYAGGTVVSQGILKQANNLSLGTPAGALLVTVSNGASLDLGGKLAGLGYVSINGNGVNANTGALETSAGMGCDIGCAPVGVKFLRLAGNASIGDNTGTFQLGTNGNANGGAGVCAIDGQGFSLTKIGSNELVVEGTNVTALSQFTLASGGMVFCNTARSPFGTTCTMVISNNAYMDSWDNYANSGINVPNNFIIGPGNGVLRDTHGMYYGHAGYNTYSGAFTLNSQLLVLNTATYGGGPGNVATSGTMTFSGPMSGPGGLSCTNGNPYTAGGATSVNTETLSGANTYTGATVVNQGLLQLSPIQQGGGAYLVYDNSTLDVPAQTGSSTVPMASLMLGASTGGTLSLSRLTALSTVNAPITATNLSVIGNNILLLPPIAYASAPGEYPLIKYTTGPSGYGTVGTIAVGGGVRGVPGYVTNDTANSEIAFVIPGGTPVVWTGTGGNNNWDINNTLNWVTNAVATTYQQTGSLGDAVTFNDSSTATNVNIPAPVAPTSAIFNNTNNTYTLIGTNITGAASLVKNGPGMLVLSNFNNNFTAGTFVSGGTLKVATALNPLVALNNLTGTVTVNAGATLDMGSNNLTTLVINASGAGVGGNGAIQANYAGNAQGWGINAVNQTGNLTIGGNNRWDVRNGTGPKWTVSPLGATLTKIGAGYTGLVGTTVSTNLGDITILGGVLSMQTSTTGLGNTNNTIWIGASGTLDFYQTAAPLLKSIVITNGGAIQIDGGNTLGQNVIAAPVTLVSGTAHINGNYFNGLYVSNTISGAGGLAMQYQTYLYLAASNTFTGPVTIPYCNASSPTRLSLIGNGSITHASLIYMNGIQPGQQAPGIIDASGRVDGTLTLGTNQTLRGDNGSYVRGSVVAPAGSAIAPGGINNSNYQYMSVSNNLTFQAGSTNFMDIYKTATLLTNDLIAVGSLVTYGGTLQIQTNGTAALAVNDSFKLFSAGSSAGNFANIVDNSGTTWSFNPATGVATVTGLPPTVNTNPATANFKATVSSGVLSFSWAPDHEGWQLYTNAVGLTATTSWFPLTGSSTVTNETITINPANPNVFFQLRYP